MKNIYRLNIAAALACGLIISVMPLVAQAATSVSIQALTPGNTVMANSLLTFQITPAGFTAQNYQLTDSFGSLSTAASESIDPGGKFSWTPLKRDAGLHNFTIVVSDFSGDTATVSLSITVTPPPSVSIQSVSPQGNVMSGTPYSFVVAAVGFTNPSYSVSDSFGGSSATAVVVGPSGNFSWTPDVSQDGDHTISVYVYDAQGHSASAMQSVTVGAGPRLSITSLTPSDKVAFGNTVSFAVGALEFIPTAFSLSDSFPNSSLDNSAINMSGLFSWVPRVGDIGIHPITIKGAVGVFGKSATTTQIITVLGSTSTPSAAAVVTAPIVTTTTTTVPPVTITSTATSDGYVFKNFIGLGEDTTDGPDVLELQKHLAQLKFFTGEQSGTFGNKTATAVKKFQKAHHILATGYVGSLTRAELNK